MADQGMGNINGQGFSSLQAPPFPGPMTNCKPCKRSPARFSSVVTDATRDLWDNLFAEGYKADVFVHTIEGMIPAHASILVSDHFPLLRTFPY